MLRKAFPVFSTSQEFARGQASIATHELGSTGRCSRTQQESSLACIQQTPPIRWRKVIQCFGRNDIGHASIYTPMLHPNPPDMEIPRSLCSFYKF